MKPVKLNAQTSFFKPEEKKQPLIAYNYAAWGDKKQSFHETHEVIKQPALQKSIHSHLELKNGLVITGSSDILQPFDAKTGKYKVIETHFADLCLWDLEQKSLISHYVVNCGNIDFLLELGNNQVILGCNDYKSGCCAYLVLMDFSDLAHPKQLAKKDLPKDCWIKDLSLLNNNELGILLFTGREISLISRINCATLFAPGSKNEVISSDLFFEASRWNDQLFFLNDEKIVTKSHQGKSRFQLYNWKTKTLENEFSLSSVKYDIFTRAIQLKNGLIVNLRTLERDEKKERVCMELHFWDLNQQNPLIKVLKLPVRSYVRGVYTLFEANGDILITPDDDSYRIIQVINKEKIKEFYIGSSLSRCHFIHGGQKILSRDQSHGLWFHNVPLLETKPERTPALI